MRNPNFCSIQTPRSISHGNDPRGWRFSNFGFPHSRSPLARGSNIPNANGEVNLLNRNSEWREWCLFSDESKMKMAVRLWCYCCCCSEIGIQKKENSNRNVVITYLGENEEKNQIACMHACNNQQCMLAFEFFLFFLLFQV